jgi:hypothetical protein
MGTYPPPNPQPGDPRPPKEPPPVPCDEPAKPAPQK